MKKIQIILIGCLLYFTSCSDLNLYPLDQGSSENWYSSETEFEMAVNDFYRIVWWPLGDESWTDDYTYRDTPGSVFISGTLNSEDSDVSSFWTNMYKAIARANTVIQSLDRGRNNDISETLLTQYEAEARFIRAACYAKLVFAFGDVVYVENIVNLVEAYQMSRTPKDEVIKKIYEDFDFAIEKLPETYQSKQRMTKGAALALKARSALYFGDYNIASQAAKACMDLKKYSLHESFASLFHTSNANEAIFLLPRSLEYNIGILGDARSYLPRNASGYASKCPSWALLASFECIDGLPIDESPLFDSHNPFKNRDPRCTATIVEFGTEHVGFDYNPHPDALKVMNYKTGKMVTNKDTRANQEFASYNGLSWKKGIDETWGSDNGYKPVNDYIIIRYADVLLIYAEAQVELNKIDQSVLDAINQVRARAYGVKPSATSDYPFIDTQNQAELRKIIRRERRSEFASEGLRYYDIIRWKIADKVINNRNCGMLYPAADLRDKVVNKGHWFWPYAPDIDENGIADFSKMIDEGLVQVLSKGNWDERQYLWPIPSKEIVINDNLKQNQGY